jgi:predicted RNase H-like nuclease (RuvC/YqgF family)
MDPSLSRLNFLHTGASQGAQFETFDAMKKLLFLLTLIASLVALPPLAGAKDKDKDKDKYRDEEWQKKRWKETRDDVRKLREQYERLAESTRRDGASRRLREQIEFLGSDVKRVSAQFERGDFDYRDFRERISRLDDSIDRTRGQFEYELKHRDRYYR